jgi:hypothetical protein
MAMTNKSFSSGPDKHIVRPGAGGGGSSAPSSSTPADGANNDLAKNVYGTPPAGTRMPRMGSEAAEAAQFTPGWGDDNAEDSIFDGSTLGTGRNVGTMQEGFGDGSSPAMGQSASVPGSPGFPGLPDDITAQGRQVAAGAPGVSAVGAVSSHGVGESNQSDLQHSGSYGGPGQKSLESDPNIAPASYGAPADLGAWGSGNANDPQWSGNYPNPAMGTTGADNSDSPQWTGRY